MIFPPSTSREYLMQKTVTYIQGSCSFSQIQNIFPVCRVKQGKKRVEKRRKEEGVRHKGLSYFLCHLLASTFTAIPLHHVKDCKQANNNSALETTAREQCTLSCSGGLSAASWEEKNIWVFCPLKKYIYLLYRGKKKVAWGFIWTIVSALAKYLWHMSFTGCEGCHHCYLWRDIPSWHIIL